MWLIGGHHAAREERERAVDAAMPLGPPSRPWDGPSKAELGLRTHKGEVRGKWVGWPARAQGQIPGAEKEKQAWASSSARLERRKKKVFLKGNPFLFSEL